MSTRVYVPSSWSGLRDLVASDGLGPAPFLAHAVTDGLRADYPEGGDEEWEYVAAAAASRSSLSLIRDEDPPRRVVLACDVATVLDGDAEDPTVVEVGEVVPFRRIAAVLVDLEDACPDVRAAVERYPDALEGVPDAEASVEAALDHELAWYLASEVGDLLGR